MIGLPLGRIHRVIGSRVSLLQLLTPSRAQLRFPLTSASLPLSPANLRLLGDLAGVNPSIYIHAHLALMLITHRKPGDGTAEELLPDVAV